MTQRWPDLLVLELLTGVDDHGGLSAAARAAGVAQPNASRMIKQLEHRLGTPLLERRPTGATLTPHGRVLVHWARRVLEDATRLIEVAEGLRSERAAELTVSASMTVAEHLLPRWLGRLRAEQPEVGLHLNVRNSVRVFEEVSEGACDVGFVESPTVPAGLHSTTVAADRLVVVVPEGHPWTRRRRPLTVAELAAMPLIVREPGSGTRTTLDVALQEYERAAPLLELGSSATVRTSVLAGMGPAVMSTLAVSGEVRAGTLKVVAVEGLDLSRRLRAVWRPPRQLSGPAGDLVTIARRDLRTADTDAD
ncbi:LysR family transcriptional regulator [Dietzia aerolata]|uniref:LysR family transcriptional regulator n=1 Tax=Dietzia aerolata TaxID=595984 RepID=A0ABV5JPR2_9ACTN